MTSSFATPSVQDLAGATLKSQIESITDELIASLPDPAQMSAEQRRGVIARYSSVLEGNFIYWMTATYLSTGSDEARSILIDNLREEIMDAHPVMLRKFAIAAHAFPTDADALSVNEELTRVRVFLGRLSGAQNLLTMAFFEGYIQRFMSYLAELAEAQGSAEMEYTDVHGVCDVAHTEGLFRAFSVEVEQRPIHSSLDPLEGVDLLRKLIQEINSPQEDRLAA